MSKPFFIWTMQRTGGSSLTGLLMTMSEYAHIVHEPFIRERLFGNITQKFDTGDNVVDDLEDIFRSTPNIKHCYELFDEEYNTLLMNAADAAGYSHIFLSRGNEISRLLSRFLAIQTKVWGPKETKKYDDIVSGKITLEPFDIDEIIKHYKSCQNMTAYIQEKLTEKNIQYLTVNFEDFYIGSREDRLHNIHQVFKFLEFDKQHVESFTDEIERRLFHSSQNSKSILKYVPNYEEAIAELTKILNITQQSKSKSKSIMVSLQSFYHSFISKAMKK